MVGDELQDSKLDTLHDTLKPAKSGSVTYGIVKGKSEVGPAKSAGCKQSKKQRLTRGG